MVNKFKNKKLKKNQIYFMVFSSGYREYFSMGNNLLVMADKILKQYNKYCSTSDEVKSLETMAQISEEEGYYFHTYIIELNSVSDTDYLEWGEQGEYIGEYLSFYKKK